MGEEDSCSFLSSCVPEISSFALRPRPKNNGACYAVYDWLLWGDLLCNVCARVKAGNEPAGDRLGAGEIKVRSCYTGSSVKSSKMRKSRHLRKFQTMISSSIRKLHYGPLWQYGEPTCTWHVTNFRSYKSVLIKLHGKKEKKLDCLLIQWHTFNM